VEDDDVSSKAERVDRPSAASFKLSPIGKLAPQQSEAMVHVANKYPGLTPARST
jgi:hypothetical protein